VILSRNIFSHPAAFNWRTCPGFRLGGRRDAGVAVNHARNVHRKSSIVSTARFRWKNLDFRTPASAASGSLPNRPLWHEFLAPPVRLRILRRSRSVRSILPCCLLSYFSRIRGWTNEHRDISSNSRSRCGKARIPRRKSGSTPKVRQRFPKTNFSSW